MRLLESALDACLEAGASVEIIHCAEALRGMRNPFCVNCESPCTGKCLRGKPLEKAHRAIAQADGIIIGSPVYFGTVSAQLKAFWDKTRYLRSAHRLLNVVGGVVSVGASHFGGQETTVRAIHDMMLVQGMIVVGDGHDAYDCGHLGAMAERPSSEDISALERARILGLRVAQVAEATRGIRVNRT